MIFQTSDGPQQRYCCEEDLRQLRRVDHQESWADVATRPAQARLVMAYIAIYIAARAARVSHFDAGGPRVIVSMTSHRPPWYG